jgi:hypothetical protein
MAEAAAQFQKGLDQLALMPDGPERRRQELELCTGLGAALMIVKGFAAPETVQVYGRARQLWEELGSPAEFLHVPRGQALYHNMRGEIDLAQLLDAGLLLHSRQRNDPAGLVLGHLCAGQTQMYAGNFAASQSHLEEVLALYDPHSHRSLVYQAGSEALAVARRREPCPTALRPGPLRRRFRSSRLDLRLVYRRLRYTRSERGEGIA